MMKKLWKKIVAWFDRKANTLIDLGHTISFRVRHGLNKYRYIILVLFLLDLSAAAWYYVIQSVEAQRLLYHAAIWRDNLQDERTQKFSGHLDRHQQIINDYFRGLKDMPPRRRDPFKTKGK